MGMAWPGLKGFNPYLVDMSSALDVDIDSCTYVIVLRFDGHEIPTMGYIMMDDLSGANHGDRG